MSALNITGALPPTRGADATSGKATEMEGDEASGGNQFGDVFRDLSKANSESGRAAETRDPAGDGAAAGQKTTKTFSLADALASVGGRRSEDGATTDASTEGATDAAAAETDVRDAASASHERTTAQADAAARTRRMQGNQGLSALLFGRADGENGLSPANSVSQDQGKATTAKDAADKAKDTSQDADPQAQPQPQVAADPAAMLSALVPTHEAPAVEAPAEAHEDAAGGAAQAVTAEAETASPAANQPMQITVLSRETHFAPIRTIGMNGGSAPTAKADPAQAPSRTTDAPATTGTATAATAATATATAGQPATSRATAAVKPWTTSLPGAKTAPSATTATASTATAPVDEDAAATAAEKTVAGQAQTAARAATADRREADARSRTESAAASTAPQTSRAAASDDVSQSRGADVTAARNETDGNLPMTGTAGIAPGGVATQNLPTLRQIGAAIATEVTTMGQAPVASADSASAQALAGPVRLLQIQLKPDDLGTVNVRMRLSSGGLEIQLRASNADTARMLEQDRAALSELLTASGITADNITIVGIDGGGSMQLTGQDAGRPFTPPETASGQTDRQERNFSDQQGRGSQEENSQNGARHDEARSRSGAADAGGDFRI
ncbi:flagellar hook-length control protein FliK [Azorhizobium doebereinerae]|uniref:flagellar hook-length control protein FliK n=1 Tax=Azorhizobium doebereinerae TaxID=281091 RepID=UPI0003F57720|nr:flagellar hook-length control protein FliK [Azorhizobium doebereinerae]